MPRHETLYLETYPISNVSFDGDKLYFQNKFIGTKCIHKRIPPLQYIKIWHCILTWNQGEERGRRAEVELGLEVLLDVSLNDSLLHRHWKVNALCELPIFSCNILCYLPTFTIWQWRDCVNWDSVPAIAGPIPLFNAPRFLQRAQFSMVILRNLTQRPHISSTHPVFHGHPA